MPDATRLAHTGSRDDDFGHGICVDFFGIIACYRKMQAIKSDRIDSPVKQFVRFLIKVTAEGLFINVGRLNRKRTVKIYRKIGKSKLLLLDTPKHI